MINANETRQLVNAILLMSCLKLYLFHYDAINGLKHKRTVPFSLKNAKKCTSPNGTNGTQESAILHHYAPIPKNLRTITHAEI